MTLQVSQQSTALGVTPTALTPAASDTIAAGSFGANGLMARVITTGTATTVSVQDPTLTGLGNAGTVAGVVCAATGVSVITIPPAAVASATQLATVLFSGARTGVTYELWRI